MTITLGERWTNYLNSPARGGFQSLLSRLASLASPSGVVHLGPTDGTLADRVRRYRTRYGRRGGWQMAIGSVSE